MFILLLRSRRPDDNIHDLLDRLLHVLIASLAQLFYFTLGQIDEVLGFFFGFLKDFLDNVPDQPAFLLHAPGRLCGSASFSSGFQVMHSCFTGGCNLPGDFRFRLADLIQRRQLGRLG